MLRTRLRQGVFATAIAGSSYAYYRYKFPSEETPKPFTVIVSGRDAQKKKVRRAMTFNLGDKNIFEQRVREKSDILISKPGEPLLKWQTAQLASNDPIEDMDPQAMTCLYDDPSRAPLVMLAIADGHSGPWTSLLLAKVMLPTIKSMISSDLTRSLFPSTKISHRMKLQGLDGPDPQNTPLPRSLSPKPSVISAALKQYFVAIDDNILSMARSKYVKGIELKEEDVGVDILPAVSGSCALVTMIDTHAKDLYVACTGDCRAVAGIWDENEDGTGSWRVDVLSEDQTGRNPKEVKRMQSLHPPEEADNVIKAGRVLGHLEPTRSFGDLRYKWSADAQKLLLPSLLPAGMPAREPPPNFKTPPYVTAEPEVTYRRYDTPKLNRKSKLKFIIMATDGLWDELTNEEAVALVGGYLSGEKGTLSHSELLKRTPVITDATQTSTGHNPRSIARRSEYTWSFQDDNVSTHLIRNALGGSEPLRLRQSLSIPAPFSRQFRDDITVSIVWWDDPSPEAAVKAKL